ncbi:MAG: carbohydrate ABC transporter permease [Nitriliruptor sp.]|nr:MAG: carbohydrate ABC transporter permease [Nitriliruptor sp.]
MTTLEEVTTRGNGRVDRSDVPLRDRPPLVRGIYSVRRSGLKYSILGLALAVSVFPFYWMFVVASNSNAVMSQFPPRVIPGPNFLVNAQLAIGGVPFVSALVNSFVVASAITVSVLFFSTMAGFAFAKMKFRGRGGLFTFILGTMLVPQQLGLIPLFILMGYFGWIGQLRAVIVPALVTAFGVFWMRQVVAGSVPDELLESARIDGCSIFGMVRHVVWPSVAPGAAVLGLYTFLFAWNDFLWPLVVLGNNPSNHTIQIALRTLSDTYYVNYSMVMAGTLLSVVPLMITFVMFSRQMVAGAMDGAVKG